ncbi:TPA: helix-turn-helix transcriptional regulator [Escherichia coli]|nr:helix-turn-helix transcriptional regulator [Escherichia coli]
MEIKQSEKLKLIRESERLKKEEIASLTGIHYVTYVGYENGNSAIPLESARKFLKISKFRKYRDWFLFDETDPSAGQIAPALAHCGQGNEISYPTGKETG